MSIYIPASAAVQIQRYPVGGSGFLFGANGGNLSVSLWYRSRVLNPSDYYIIWLNYTSLGNVVAIQNQLNFINFGAVNNTINAVSAGTGWNFLAMTCNSLNGSSTPQYIGYLAQANTPSGFYGPLQTFGPFNDTEAIPTFNQFILGGTSSTPGLDGFIENVKIWTDVLTPDELQLEMLHRVPQRTYLLDSWYPLTTVQTASQNLNPLATATANLTITPACNISTGPSAPISL
jgi:hypothetical protein